MPVGTEEGLELHTPEYERRIAETLADRRPSRKDVLERAERRERIATTVYASMFTAIKSRPTVQERGMWAAEAVAAADALMAELDRRYLEERGS